MLITIVWRGSGILVPIYVLINAWIVGHWYDDHRIGNYAMTGWILFYSALVTLLHGLAVFPWKPVPVTDENGNATGTEKRGSIMSHHFFYIPVVIWAVILGVLSGLSLSAGSSSSSSSATTAPTKEDSLMAIDRTVYISNPTNDSMAYLVSSAEGYWKEDTLEPNSHTTLQLSPGSYVFGSFDMANNGVLRLPGNDILNDTTKCREVKDDKGKKYHERILRPTTAGSDDYDDAWIFTSSDFNMLLVDVSSICKANRTEADINAIDWTKNLVAKYSGDDFIEPLYGKKPAKGKYTVLSTSDDIPNKIGAGEKIMLLLTASTARELTSEYLAKRLIVYCPELNTAE